MTGTKILEFVEFCKKENDIPINIRNLTPGWAYGFTKYSWNPILTIRTIYIHYLQRTHGKRIRKKLDHPVILSFHFLAYTSREMCFLTIEDKYTIFL